MSTSTARSRSGYHHGDLRASLLDAAASVARESGSDALSLREVARRAGVSHTAAYNHFIDKRDLLRGLATRAFHELGARLERVVANGDADLSEVAVAYLRFAWEHPSEFGFMFQRSLCMPPGERDPINDASRASQEALRSVIVRAQQRGLLRDGDPESLALTFWSQVHGMSTIMLETPQFKQISLTDAESLLRSAVETLVAGMGATAAQ